MTNNLLKSMWSSIWSYCDYILNIDIPITDTIAVTGKGILYFMFALAVIIPIVHLFTNYRG